MKTLSDTWDERSRDRAELMSEARHEVRRCAQDPEDACTPRAPRPEWFGNPETAPGKGDSWWCEWSDGETCFAFGAYLPAGRPADDLGFNAVNRYTGRDIRDDLNDLILCLPVARKGYPGPVGWKVVGG